MSFSEYDSYDGLGLAELVRSKKVKPEELLEEALARVERVDPKIKAIVHLGVDEAHRQMADFNPNSPFAGVPFLAKDLGPAVKGMPTTWGCRAYKKLVPAQHDSVLFQRIKKSGCVVFGKTKAPEFGQLPITEPKIFGPCRNPWDTSRSPGGSSGGAGAAVAAGIVPMAHASDGGGSIRCPASCTGLFGLKPSRGRQPIELDVIPIGFLSVEHAITRSVRDSAALLDATNGAAPGSAFSAPPHSRSFLSEVGRAPGKLKIAVCHSPMLGNKVHPECRAAVDHTAKLLEELGHHVEEAEPENVDYTDLAKRFLVLWATAAGSIFSRLEAEKGRSSKSSDFEVATWGMIQASQILSAWDVAKAVEAEGRLATTMNNFFAKYDLLLTPVVAAPPVKIGQLVPKLADELIMLATVNTRSAQVLDPVLQALARKSFEWTSFCAPFNMTGQPAMSVPLYWTKDNLPVGTHLVARFGEEATLLQVAAQLEQAQPWASKRPPVWSGQKVEAAVR
jgi:amidase